MQRPHISACSSGVHRTVYLSFYGDQIFLAVSWSSTVSTWAAEIVAGGKETDEVMLLVALCCVFLRAPTDICLFEDSMGLWD